MYDAKNILFVSLCCILKVMVIRWLNILSIFLFFCAMFSFANMLDEIVVQQFFLNVVWIVIFLILLNVVFVLWLC